MVKFNLSELYAKPDYLLLDHLLDVGYVAEALMKYGRAKNMVKVISKSLKCSEEVVISSISWLCALHDIGKAHPNFIAKMYADSEIEELRVLYESLRDRGLVKDGDFSGFRHERYSRDILKDYFYDNGYNEYSEYYADLVAYHHQGKTEFDFSTVVTCDIDKYKNMHEEIINEVNKIWEFSSDFTTNTKYLDGVEYSILSIMVTADWIASGTKWRTMIMMNPDKASCAKKFIENNELEYKPIKDRFKYLKWDDVFSFKPNEMQTTVIQAAKENPQLMIVEYPCGGGKTEAALAAAMLMGKDKSGIFIATPTMSTAKNMNVRMNELTKSIGLDINIPEFDSSALWSDNDMTKIPKYLWTSRSRHRMLYPFAVGTIDQILKTMLYYRYGCIGLMGLSDKVLVIDEVHAYDSYMITELKKLLKWAQFLEIPVILLSATLPTITKLDLLRSIGYKQRNIPNYKEYPLVTTYSTSGYNSYPINSTGRTFKINVIETDDYRKTWIDEMSKNYNGCTAYIEGTVDSTWTLYNTANNLSLNPTIFTGRDSLIGKETKTLDLINKLGKNRDNRPNKYTLTATSIIEQSLDIDLDRMFTCIAPIDLLIQRFGRVWRHSDKGTIRETETIDTPITIIIPKNLSDIYTIYNTTVLHKTIEAIKSLSQINTVTDARYLIDTVYDSIELIKDIRRVINAGYKCIEDPNRDAMFDNNNLQYSKFTTIQELTRYNSYPTINIAIVEPEDLENITEDYDKIKKIMQYNTVTISEYKSRDIFSKPITVDHKLLSDVVFYMKDDLATQNIFLTNNGLKWHNN